MYPPSLVFVLMTLGANLLLLASIAALSERLTTWGRPLLTFGRTALFFYIVHLYLYAVIGLAFPHGTTLLRMYPVWFLGLAIVYPLCVRYGRFKAAKPPTSLWRLF